MIIGIVGFAQTGKDLIANILSDTIKAQRIAFADPVKRVVRDIFEFSEEQLWGTQTQKESPDLRYPRSSHDWDPERYYSQKDYGFRRKCLCCGLVASHDDVTGGMVAKCYLTPRYAMKKVGTEGARASWDPIWVKKALDDAGRVQEGYTYTKQWGVEPPIKLPTYVLRVGGEEAEIPAPDRPERHVVFPDTRFIDEVEGILDNGGRVYRVKRTGYDRPAFNHPSETEQLQIPDARLHGVIYNDSTPEDLEIKLRGLFC